MTKFFCISLFLASFTLQDIFAQQKEQPNIIPNPSFELFASTPLGWYYKGEHFTSVMKYWSSPTTTSPDAYGPKVRVPESWAEKGFGKQKAHSGNAMIGLTLYGCINGKPHCREYVQIQLAEPLVINQDYVVEFWYNCLSRSLRINNIGAAFSKKMFNQKTEDPLTLLPTVQAQEVLNITKNQTWQKFSMPFKATDEFEYLILGNFLSDQTTVANDSYVSDNLNFAYYYFDDILVKKIPPILPIPVKEDDLTKIKIEKGKVFLLKNIYFQSNNFELQPRSFVELQKLLFLMRENPTLSIEVRGHTDDEGAHDYNLKLSQDRAQSVANFLLYNNVDKKRIKVKGYGESQPLSDNMTDEGKQANRRVEFAILSQ
jgi:OmpA-OmpF porin, OOP family